MNKYIVRNCPAYRNNAYAPNCIQDATQRCEDNEECFIKQIVKHCNEQLNCLKNKQFACPDCEDAAANDLAFDIISDIDIQEVEKLEEKRRTKK